MLPWLFCFPKMQEENSRNANGDHDVGNIEDPEIKDEVDVIDHVAIKKTVNDIAERPDNDEIIKKHR